MSKDEIFGIEVVSPFRHNGQLLEAECQLEIDEDISKRDARAMVACGKAEWLYAEEEEPDDE